MKRVIVINQDSGYLIVDIVNCLSDKNIDVSLLAGRVVFRSEQLHESVKIRKIIRYNRSSKFKRIFSWTVGFFQILFLIKTKFRKDYLFIVTNPPFAIFLPLFCTNNFSLMIFDVYPDVLTKMGILSDNSTLLKLWQRTNKKIFARADNIFTLTESMSALIKHYTCDKEIIIVSLWGDNSYFKIIPRETNPFSFENNLVNRFVVMYSGNLGATHNVEIFADLAQKVKNPKIIFVIIGEGDRKKTLEEKIRKLNLSNCLVLPLQPVERIPYSFSAADMAMISLNSEASGLSLPSKTFSFMSAGLPLLCIAGEDSELRSLIVKYNNGRCFTPDKLDEIATFIEEMERERDILEIYKANSLIASRDFTVKNAGIISEMIKIFVEKN